MHGTSEGDWAQCGVLQSAFRRVLLPLQRATPEGREVARSATDKWNVTNVSMSGMPARLLRARLAIPRLPDARPEFEEARGNVIIQNSGTEVIAANTTERITIHFSVLLPPSRLRSLTLYIVVIDQLSNEHALPRITVKPQMLQPANSRPDLISLPTRCLLPHPNLSSPSHRPISLSK
jgi:hypothetical protein